MDQVWQLQPEQPCRVLFLVVHAFDLWLPESSTCVLVFGSRGFWPFRICAWKKYFIMGKKPAAPMKAPKEPPHKKQKEAAPAAAPKQQLISR